MNRKASNRRDATATPALAPSSGAAHDANPGDPNREDRNRRDHFLQLMFFQASDGPAAAHGPAALPPLTGDFAPLRNAMTGASEGYRLPSPGSNAPLRPDSPAIEVMTDLRRVAALTIDRDASIAEANRVMIARGVRALFVIDDAREMLGIVTATDTLGERPIQFAQARAVRYDEVTVRDIMTPADRVEVLDLRDVMRARVGDIVATLRTAGRQHALVAAMADGAGSGPQTICGIISLTQIGRRMGLPPQPLHDIARTFGEIEALIAPH